MKKTIIRGGKVVDGLGGPSYRADIRIEGDRITAIGEIDRDDDADVVDASGRIVCPGLIDVHTHDDMAVINSPDMLAKISQGVTTVIVGNCGVSLAPYQGKEPATPPLSLFRDPQAYRYATVSDWRQAVESASPSVNVAKLIGHAILRHKAMDQLDRPASEAEIEVMRQELETALSEGAIGLSTGLAYPAARDATEQEVTAIASIMATTGGVYCTHLRNERERVVESVSEALRTAANAEVPLVISHHKCMGRTNHGLITKTLQMIDASPDEVALDVYPYLASSTALDPSRVKDADRILISYSTPHPEVIGRDLTDIAAEWGMSPIEAAEQLMPGSAIYFEMSEDDLKRVMRNPRTMFGSDGISSDSHPHPRLWGTFPRVLGRYVRDQGLLGLEEAIHRMTKLSADNFGIINRGVIRIGAYADLMVFDADTIIDHADFQTPTRPAAGVEAVFVNGVLSYLPSQGCINHAGRVLTDRRRKPTY